jgi:putative transposase
MRLLNQRYVARFNRRHRHTGTLWESRFRSCLVDTESYLLTLYRYIELNPVRAALVDAPERYRWSSARANLGITTDSCVTPHPFYLALGADATQRAKAYDEWLHSGLADEDLAAIRSHIQQERALGSPRFQAMVAKTLSRPVAVRPRGRPRKITDGSASQ